jgi:hypothetical protein
MLKTRFSKSIRRYLRLRKSSQKTYHQAAAELERLRAREQTEAFQQMADRARAVYAKKKEEYRATRAGGPGTRMCRLTERELTNLRRRFRRRQDACATSSVVGECRWTWAKLLRSYSTTGCPCIYLQPGVEDKLEGKGLDTRCGGVPLRDLVTSDLRHYLLNRKAYMRRIIVVSNPASIPFELQLVANLLGARVQTQVMRPLLQHRASPPLTLAFTVAFAQKHKRVVMVARAVACAYETGRVRVLHAKMFLRKMVTSSPRELRCWSLIYDNDDDEELKSMTASQISCARSFPELMRTLGHAHAVREA